MCEEFIEERCEKLIKREMSLSCNVIGYQYLAFYEAKGAKLANKKPSFIFKEPIGKPIHWPFVPFLKDITLGHDLHLKEKRREERKICWLILKNTWPFTC